MGKNTHQHFVPKFYQKGFSENNLIYSLDKNTKPYKPEKISIRDFDQEDEIFLQKLKLSLNNFNDFKSICLCNK